MFKISQFFPICTKCLRQNHVTRSVSLNKFFSTNKNLDIENEHEPIKYSVSPASKYKAQSSRTGVTRERLWYEQYVVMGSIAVFLLYFCVFREENDLDDQLTTSLYSRIEGLEEYQLRLSLKYKEEKGMDTLDIIKRLEEIEKEKHK